MKPLIVIPARGGSKGIPGKNIKELHGKPLILYTIEAALSVCPADHIIVSTDSPDIKSVVENAGIPVPFLRPAHLATDTASSYDVILHAMQFAEKCNIPFDAVVLLQPTSPFRTGKHILEAMSLYARHIDMVVSVKESEENPYYSLFEESSDGYLEKSKDGDFTRRQDCPKVYSYNGAIYVMNPDSLKTLPIHKFKKVQKYVMNSTDSIDIDTELDWILAESIIKQRTDDLA